MSAGAADFRQGKHRRVLAKPVDPDPVVAVLAVNLAEDRVLKRAAAGITPVSSSNSVKSRFRHP